LALLALSAGRVVAVSTLVDALWGDELPSNPGNALQVRVSKLRRAFTAAGIPSTVLVTGRRDTCSRSTRNTSTRCDSSTGWRRPGQARAPAASPSTGTPPAVFAG